MTYSEHRKRARTALAGKWGQAALFTLVAVLLGGIELSGSQLNINLDAEQTVEFGYDLASLVTFVLSNFLRMNGGMLTAISLVLGIALVIIGGPIRLGYIKYCLRRINGEESELGILFAQFHRLGDVLVLNLLIALVAIVPTLASAFLLVISPILGGLAMIVVICGLIYVSFGLTMGFYILAEDENCKATEAMRRSWELMDGHRMDFFVLGLTFLGWQILSAFTLGIGGFFLTPYVHLTNTSFYLELKPKAQEYIPSVGPEF